MRRLLSFSFTLLRTPCSMMVYARPLERRGPFPPGLLNHHPIQVILGLGVAHLEPL